MPTSLGKAGVRHHAGDIRSPGNPTGIHHRSPGALVRVATAVMLLAIAGTATAHAQPQATRSANTSIFATGLDNPRGLRWGPDGNLYVAEGGRGGSTSTEGQCTQVPPPIGPITGGKTARISRISPTGVRSTVVDGLPSAQVAPTGGSEVLGVADVEFVDGTLYTLLEGGGCPKGNPDVPNAILRVNADGTTTEIANLSTFYLNNPVATPALADNDPEGVPYSMVRSGSDLLVLESNHGELDRVTLGGTVTRIVDISAVTGHSVPTALAVGPDGNFYVGNVTQVPYVDGTAVLYRITPSGQMSVFARGLTAVLGLAFDAVGRLYVLESATGNTSQPPFYHPGTGRVLRMNGTTFETVATGLSFPTAMTFGPDGNLYVSNRGFGVGPTGGKGEIVRVALEPATSMPLPDTSIEGSPVTFPETGYSLEGDLLSAWRDSGGLKVFGYPIDSSRAVDGQVMQWLERARFELHVTDGGMARLLLGRLGAEALAVQDRDWRSFPKAPAGVPHRFPETGHAITHAPFWDFWSRHGLEFDGERGTSRAESLALFGYPLSEAHPERTASGEQVLVQWFERARFEYYPANAPEFRVQLGRLGTELHGR